MKHILKHEYPNLKSADYKKALSFIDGKYSQYYFLDYMRCSNGNVDDAIQFSILDEKLRSLLFQNIICFEIQVKTDFAISVSKETHCSNFWKKKKFYLPDATVSRSKGKNSKYFLVKRKIKSGINKLHFETMGPSHLVAMYTCTFGTFIQLFKYIGKNYKQDFILKYSKNLNNRGYKIVNSYFEAIKRIRNRCAHGNHLISKKLLYDLNNLNHVIDEQKTNNAKIVVEKTFKFMIENLYCGENFRKELIRLFKKYKDLLSKYSKNHSIPTVFYKHS